MFSILSLRGIKVPVDRYQQISTCTDRDLLVVWLQRALDAEHIDDLVDDTTRSESRS